MKKDFKKLQLDELGRLSVDEFLAKKKIPVTVVLDNVRSANNVGSVFRTADAFLIEQVILCGITAQPPHKEIQKTALGAQNSVSWKHVDSTITVVSELQSQGYIVVSVEQVTNSVMLHDFQVECSEKYALVLGNEVSGVGEDVVKASDVCVEIPQFGTKHSFNISVTCGMVLWDFAKKLLV